MDKVIEFEVELWPPSANHYWGMHGKIIYPTKQNKEFRKVLGESIVALGCNLMLEGDLKAVIGLRMPDRRKRDVKNYDKVLLDAMQGLCYENDHQIKDCRVYQIPGIGELIRVQLMESDEWLEMPF